MRVPVVNKNATGQFMLTHMPFIVTRFAPVMIYVTTLHDFIAIVSCDSSCKLASKLSYTSAAKRTVEAVLDLEVNNQIINFLDYFRTLHYSHNLMC